MKKMFFVAVSMVATLVASQQMIAADSTVTQPTQTQAVQIQPLKKSVQKADWDFFQLGFWFGIPSQTKCTDVYGIKVGVPGCGGKGKVTGIETSIFASGTDTVVGVSSSVLVATSKNVTGFQGSIVNYSQKVKGLQLGVLNMAKDQAFQIGIINYIKDSPIPILPIINVRFK